MLFFYTNKTDDNLILVYSLISGEMNKEALLAYVQRIIQPYTMYRHINNDRNLPTHDVSVL